MIQNSNTISRTRSVHKIMGKGYLSLQRRIFLGEQSLLPGRYLLRLMKYNVSKGDIIWCIFFNEYCTR